MPGPWDDLFRRYYREYGPRPSTQWNEQLQTGFRAWMAENGLTGGSSTGEPVGAYSNLYNQWVNSGGATNYPAYANVPGWNAVANPPTTTPPTKTTSTVGPAITNAPAPGNINLGWTGRAYTGTGPMGYNPQQQPQPPASIPGGQSAASGQAGFSPAQWEWLKGWSGPQQYNYWRDTIGDANNAAQGNAQLNRYGQPFWTQGPYNNTFRRQRSKGTTPGYWQEQRFGDTVTYQNPNHGVPNQTQNPPPGGGGGNAGGGSSGGGGNLYNDLINWRI